MIRQVKLSENNVLKVNELQQPIVGGSWKSKSELGEIEVKIEPYWTGERWTHGVSHDDSDWNVGRGW